jgi:hypothetical protein
LLFVVDILHLPWPRKFTSFRYGMNDKPMHIVSSKLIMCMDSILKSGSHGGLGLTFATHPDLIFVPYFAGPSSCSSWGDISPCLDYCFWSPIQHWISMESAMFLAWAELRCYRVKPDICLCRPFPLRMWHGLLWNTRWVSIVRRCLPHPTYLYWHSHIEYTQRGSSSWPVGNPMLLAD